MLASLRRTREILLHSSALQRCRAMLWLVALGLAVYLAVAPKPWSINDPVKVWGWGGGLAALAGTLVLLSTARWWMRGPNRVPPDIHRERTPLWFWPLVLAAVAVTAATAATRLGHDLWADEEVTLRLFVHGSYKAAPDQSDGSVVFREVGAGRAFHHYAKPTNHVLHSILARASVSLWRFFRDPQGAPFSETALRFPAYLFGLLAVAALALLVKELGFPRAGIIAAFLLALHPWFLRYASEARGYSMVLCFFSLQLFCWLRAMHTNRWPWWAGTGAAQFCLVYTFPAAVFPVAALALVTALLLACGFPRDIDRGTAALRWCVSSAAGALLFIMLFSPCLPQLLDYIGGQTQARGTMGRPWLQDFGSYLLAGESWFKSRGAHPLRPELHHAAASAPTVFYGVVGGALLAALVGAFRLAGRGTLAAALLVALVLPAPLAYETALIRGWYLYEFYLIYALTGAVALVAIGLDATGNFARTASLGATITAVCTLLFAAGYMHMTQHVRTWLITKPLEPMRASVLLTRPTTLPNYPGHANTVTASFCQPAYLYDPHYIRIKSTEELRALMRRCDRDAKPLYLNLGGMQAAMVTEPEMYRLATMSGMFETVGELAGFEPYGDRLVVRYVPRSLGTTPIPRQSE